MRSEDISDQIRNIFQNTFDDATKDNNHNPFASLSKHHGFTLRKDISSIPNAGHGIYLMLLIFC